MKGAWWPHTLLGLALLCNGCGTDPKPDDGALARDRMALVVVVESHETIAPEISRLFDTNRDAALDLAAQIFGVPRDQLAGMSPAEIEDVYAEEWMISQLQLAAQDHYARFVSLTDSRATARQCVAAAQEMSADGCLVDLVFVLHGDRNAVWFADQLEDVQTLTGDLAVRRVPIRALYQTCCYGAEMIDDWEGTGTSAVNGARGANQIAMFAPVFFLQRWTGGAPFDQAVQGALQDEITMVRLYQQQLGSGIELLTAEQIAESEQVVGGRRPDLPWSDFSAFLRPQTTGALIVARGD